MRNEFERTYMIKIANSIAPGVMERTDIPVPETKFKNHANHCWYCDAPLPLPLEGYEEPLPVCYSCQQKWLIA